MIISMDGDEIVQTAEDYRRISKYTKERLTVRQFGLEVLDEIMQRGYRVIVSAGRTLGYQTEDGRGCECDFCKVGKGKNTVLPNRKGEIFEIYIPPANIANEPLIERMVWFSRGLDDENISLTVDEEDRLEDLLVYDLMPPEKIVPVEREPRTPPTDSRQKFLFN